MYMHDIRLYYIQISDTCTVQPQQSHLVVTVTAHGRMVFQSPVHIPAAQLALHVQPAQYQPQVVNAQPYNHMNGPNASGDQKCFYGWAWNY